LAFIIGYSYAMFVSNGGRINNNRVGLAVIGYRTVLFW